LILSPNKNTFVSRRRTCIDPIQSQTWLEISVLLTMIHIACWKISIAKLFYVGLTQDRIKSDCLAFMLDVSA